MKTAIVADAGKKFAKIYEGLSDEVTLFSFSL